MTIISTTGNIGKGSATVDVADQTGIVDGMRVSGIGIPFGATVFRVGTPNLIMLTDNALENADGVAVTFADDIVEEKPAEKVPAPNPPPAAVRQAVVVPPAPIGKAPPPPPTAKERAAKPTSKSKPAARRR